MPKRETITEPAREIPVFRTCDVLVVGGGPAGSAAAASAARLGADTILVERYGHLGGMMSLGLDNLLAAGRNLSCDAVTHIFMREVPNCWAMGQAAGVAAAVAISAGVRVRDVDVGEVQRRLLRQGVPLHEEVGGSIRRPGAVGERKSA